MAWGGGGVHDMARGWEVKARRSWTMIRFYGCFSTPLLVFECVSLLARSPSHPPPLLSLSRTHTHTCACTQIRTHALAGSSLHRSSFLLLSLPTSQSHLATLMGS